MKSFDVIIIGYGPTGGTLASLLVKSNLSVLILEKEKSLYPLPRAVHFDDEIMRVFDTIGIKEKFKKFTIINKGTKFVDNKGKVLLDWPRPREITENGSYPSYRFHQPDFEKVIRNHLKGYKNFSSKQNSNVIEIKNTKNYVDIISEDTETLKQDTFRCKYLVGCDGANSITRKIINSQFDNLGFNQKWAVIDLILKKNKKLPDRTIQYANSKRPATYCRNVGKRRRWEFVIKNNENEKKVVSDSFIWDFLKPWVKSNEAKIERKAIYTFKSRLAEHWVEDRLILAGDSAHLTPPFMGQGMCIGLRDVSNLAWKLISVVRGQSDLSFLKSYEIERRPHAKEYISTAIKLGKMLGELSSNSKKGKEGPIHMKSLAPKIGNAFSIKEEEFARSLSLQPKLSNGQYVDDIVGYKFCLFLSEDLASQFSGNNSNIIVFNSKDHPTIKEYLENLSTKALLIRPDKYILGGAKNLTELNELLSLEFINSVNNKI